MGTALDDLIALLDLEPLEVNLFRGVSPKEDRQRVFGGQVAGQALVAAGRTVEADRPVHSLHAYFLRPGDPTVPIIYEVDRIRDGKSFTTRRVVGIQHGRAIFNLAASFHVEESGPEHQDPMPDVPTAEELPTFREQMAKFRDRFSPEMAEWLERERPIDQRPTELPSWMDPGSARAAPGRLDQGQRHPARRPAAARLHRRLRVGPHDPRHRDAPARQLVPRGRVPDREPRPRDVVPPAVPGRLVVALPPAQPVRERRRAASRRARSSRSDGQLAVTVIQEGLMRPIRHRT